MSQYLTTHSNDPLVVLNDTDDVVVPDEFHIFHKKDHKVTKSSEKLSKYNDVNCNLTALHLSDVSNLTVNDTTTSSFENEMELLDPVSFADDNHALPSTFEIYRNSHKPLTLNDVNDDATDIDSVNGFLKSSIGKSSDGIDYCMDKYRLSIDLDMEAEFDLDLDTHLGSELNTSEQPGLSLSSGYPSEISNAYTPSSKILSNTDVSSEDLKRSFTRLKQTSELLNTEKVYICSLRILERVYLKNFMSDLPTPIYFQTFRKCVYKLLKKHQLFYDSIAKIYNKWYDDSVALLNLSAQNHNGKESSAFSPSFDKYNYVSNEKSYLETIVKLLANDSVDVDTYSTYCSLYQQILAFCNQHNMERYKRDSLIILNDYQVQHKNLHNEMFTDKHLDTRFISVVQMPTTRMVRYKLMLLSLLKNIELDEKNSALLIYYSDSIEKLNFKIDAINSFVGNESVKFAKIQSLRNMFKNNESMFPSNLFLENLEDLQLASSFGVVYPSYKNTINYQYLCGILCKSHLILARPSSIYSNSLEVKFVVPLMSILNMEYSTCLSTSYSDVINLTFEDRFNVYECGMIFPDEKEMLLWKAKLRLNIDKLNFTGKSDNLFQHNYIFSDLQRKVLSIELNGETERFKVSCLISQNIKPVRNNTNNDSKLSGVCYYDVDHFSSDFNSTKKRIRTNSVSSDTFDVTDSNSMTTSNMTRSSTLQSIENKHHIVKITIQERCSAQTCISSIWSNGFEVYTMSMSISRSLSNIFHSRLSLLSLGSNTATSNINVPNTPKGQFVPPSPSFAMSGGGPLRSPARLRNSKSVRTFQEFRRTTSANTADDNIQKSTLKTSGSFLSLAGIAESSKNANSLSVSLENDVQKPNTKYPGSSNSLRFGTDTDSIISTSSSKKLSNGVTRLWRSIKSSSVKRNKNKSS
ncbi:hypothetical protein CANINC_000858 [Pichia inconspicua]|uniref:DH domain-containing protein n=1 Tax=Pichia inconspicua TaxID=52247 RepID=A0A4T0X5C2_9ASCO|nr:hypothetical protein CANINC_000858 [[Candida] inconspicua]